MFANEPSENFGWCTTALAASGHEDTVVCANEYSVSSGEARALVHSLSVAVHCMNSITGDTPMYCGAKSHSFINIVMQSLPSRSNACGEFTMVGPSFAQNDLRQSALEL